MNPIIVQLDFAVRSEIPGRGVSLTLVNQDAGSDNCALHVNILDPGSQGPLHYHQRSENAYFILEGTAEVNVSGRVHRLEAETFIFIPPGVVHSVANNEIVPLKLLEVYAPPQVDDFIEVVDD